MKHKQNDYEIKYLFICTAIYAIIFFLIVLNLGV